MSRDSWRFIREVRTIYGLRWLWRKTENHLTAEIVTKKGEIP